jgi:predicted NUDIX family NTP pyrophosphohydrolase
MLPSAGILLYKYIDKVLLVFLVHPGGPFWAKKDLGAWSIPKGEFDVDEEPFLAAVREFKEETGQTPSIVNAIKLTPVRQKSGKIVHAWAVEGDVDAANIVSNEIEIEWPPRSGKKITIPEVDRGEWFSIDEAKEKINPAQVKIIDELVNSL